jgi:uncharacterized protein (TIGR00375 family)
MRFIADFHVHSRHSRATSPEMVPEGMAKWAARKGIRLLGTGDFTHPVYFAELKSKLEPGDGGLLRFKKSKKDVAFILTVEVSNIFSQGGRTRKVHTLIFAPDFEAAEKINSQLAPRGKLQADGRPTFTFPVKELVKLVLDISPDCLIVPAHAWTPWFSLFGSSSGFDSLEECFGELSRYIFAIETGLSSDPMMNRRLSALDRICLISNSDAHSPRNIGREANLFDCPLDYNEIIQAIKMRDKGKFISTLEFFPQEGKYHYDGHRNCNLVFSPEQSRANGDICPVCGRPLTLGVMHRVMDLADRPAGFVADDAIPARHLVPLEEIIAEVLGMGVASKGVQSEYDRMIQALGPELNILLEVKEDELVQAARPELLQAILNVRKDRVQVIPGYDGVYGKIKTLGKVPETGDRGQNEGQMSLFS